MGATILNEAVIGDGCIVGADALVSPGKTYPENSLLLGAPARVVRTVSDEEREEIRTNAARYRDDAARYLQEATEATARIP